VDGIFTADPQLDPTAQPIASITPETLAAVVAGLGSSHGVDVTGGMYAKVMQSLAMVQRHPGLEIVVCSGMKAAHVRRALAGAAVGTRISVQEQAQPVSASAAMRL
jgi:isopentenyl phosphate kinase